jgi:galactonate dehydratase
MRPTRTRQILKRCCVATRPGLGIEIDEGEVERMTRQGHRWRNPVWRHPDGSFAEW